MLVEVMFTRARSVAEEIERRLQSAAASVDAALYRLNNPRLAQALAEASRRGVRVRLVLDRTKYSETAVTREFLACHQLSFRLLSGRQDTESKMHLKFAILDGGTVLTGSYNWTVESEEQNFEDLVILEAADQTAAYRREFEALWNEGSEPQGA